MTLSGWGHWPMSKTGGVFPETRSPPGYRGSNIKQHRTACFIPVATGHRESVIVLEAALTPPGPRLPPCPRFVPEPSPNFAPMPRLRGIIRRDFVSKLGRRVIRILWKVMMLYAALWDPQWSQEAQPAEAPASQPPFHRDLRDWAYHRASTASPRSSSSSSSESIKIDVPTAALDCAFALLDAELRELPDSDDHDDS